MKLENIDVDQIMSLKILIICNKYIWREIFLADLNK